MRKNSVHTSPISYEDHLNWFREKIQSNDSDLFIYYNNSDNIGHIRLDYYFHTAKINFYIDKNYRRMGHGANMLKLVEEVLKSRRTDIIRLDAFVKKDNKTSQNCFLKLGYNINKTLTNESYVNFYKDLSGNYI